MEPLTPATSTLAPAISHIAETAAALAKDLASRNTQLHNNDQAKADQEETQAAKEKQFDELHPKQMTHLEFECVAGDHPRWEEIRAGLLPFLQSLSRYESAQWEPSIAKGVDGVAIMIGDDGAIRKYCSRHRIPRITRRSSGVRYGWPLEIF